MSNFPFGQSAFDAWKTSEPEDAPDPVERDPDADRDREYDEEES